MNKKFYNKPTAKTIELGSRCMIGNQTSSNPDDEGASLRDIKFEEENMEETFE